MKKSTLKRSLSFAAFIALAVSTTIVAAALYNIVGTKNYVNGIPSSLTIAERAKMITVTSQAQTEAACVQPCILLSRAQAKLVIKKIIVDETPAPTCPQFTTGKPPACSPIPCGTGFTGNQPNCVAVVVVVPPPPPAPGSNIIQQGLMPAVDINKNIAPQVGFSDLRVKSSDEPLYDGGGEGAFRISCGVSHMSNDDPMVFPNQKDATHHHTFYGNTSVKYNSNLNTLATTGNSTCWGGIMNRSAYWHPTLIDTKTNSPVLPEGGAIFYYKTGYNGVPISTIKAPPTGLRMLAGNSKATTASQKKSTYYQCMSTGRRFESIPNCTAGDTMQMEVEFPQCWDGKNLDSPDHISHMAEASGGCPTSHPVAIPRITLNLRFKVKANNEALNWRLSSDNYTFNGSNAGYSGHADWVNGWDEGFLKGIVVNCLNAGRDGRAHLLCDGRQFYPD